MQAADPGGVPLRRLLTQSKQTETISCFGVCCCCSRYSWECAQHHHLHHRRRSPPSPPSRANKRQPRHGRHTAAVLFLRRAALGLVTETSHLHAPALTRAHWLQQAGGGAAATAIGSYYEPASDFTETCITLLLQSANAASLAELYEEWKQHFHVPIASEDVRRRVRSPGQSSVQQPRVGWCQQCLPTSQTLAACRPAAGCLPVWRLQADGGTDYCGVCAACCAKYLAALCLSIGSTCVCPISVAALLLQLGKLSPRRGFHPHATVVAVPAARRTTVTPLSHTGQG